LEHWTKGLIAAVCVIVLAGTYFIWNKYNQTQERVERRERIERARKELFGFAEAEVNETKKVRDFCRDQKARADAGATDITLERILERCRDFEYIK
jgi:hypothetical protein